MWRAAALALIAGCRAGVSPPDFIEPQDFAAPADAVEDGTPPADLSPAPDLCPAGPERCADGCDNDGDGYADGDDPDCAPIAIAGIAAGDAVRWALVQPTTFKPLLSLGAWTGSAAYRRDVTPGEAWVTDDGNMRLVRRVRLGDGKTAWSSMLTYVARDVCFFGGNAIVVEQDATNFRLHQLKPDGTELRVVAVGQAPAACASDGQTLWVAVHTGAGRSQFLAYDANLSPAGTRPMPGAIAEDRCIDFAWTSRGFYGLFVVSGGQLDVRLSARQARPFAMDGGVGAPVAIPDSGVALHSLGELVP